MLDLAEVLLDWIEIDDDAVWQQFKKKLEDTKDFENSLHEVELSQPLLEHVVKETWKRDTQCLAIATINLPPKGAFLLSDADVHHRKNIKGRNQKYPPKLLANALLSAVATLLPSIRMLLWMVHEHTMLV